MSKSLGKEILPLTEEKILGVAAVLRASGYRAVLAYIIEAKSRHVRTGYAWSEKLQTCLADVKRAVQRATGPPVRAEGSTGTVGKVDYSIWQ